MNEQGESFQLTGEQRRLLLEIARESVINAARRKSFHRPADPDPDDDILNSHAGLFVTLYGPSHELRGCIGFIEGEHHLPMTVALAAEAAATRDSRFSPVREEELDGLTISISVLTPPVVISDTDVIEPGQHGLIIQRGLYRGLLLPQVAEERGWDRETFLRHTCMKAGLPVDAWEQEETEISVFSALVFSEDDMPAA